MIHKSLHQYTMTRHCSFDNNQSFGINDNMIQKDAPQGSSHMQIIATPSYEIPSPYHYKAYREFM